MLIEGACMRKLAILITTVLLGAGFAIFGVAPRTSLTKCVIEKDSRLIEAKKGDTVDCAILAWNKKQIKTACVADKDLPMLSAKKGDHIVCDDAVIGGTTSTEKPTRIPDNYCVVYYTSGCPTCAVGWVYAKGARCENCLNCSN
jgi:hypothetical protein